MIESVSKSSGFSFQRVWAYALYYLPRLKGEMLIYFAIALFCSIITLIPAPDEVQKAIGVGIWSILPIIFYCGPLIFAKGGDTRIIERLMPGSAAEKLTFYYIYNLVIIPIIVYGLPLAACWIYISCPAINTPSLLELYQMKFTNWGMVMAINTTGAVLISMACLYGVEASRQNRMLFGIVGVVVGNVIIGIIGGIIGVSMALKAFSAGVNDSMNGTRCNPDEVGEQIVKEMMESIAHPDALSISLLAVIVVLIIVTGCLTYRAIKRKNL